MSAEAGSPITTYFRVCDGVRVRFADTKADSDVTVLLLAPWPESLWAFRRIWDRVAAVGRAVAIDMPGFGHSDGRPELIAPDVWGAKTRVRCVRRRELRVRARKRTPLVGVGRLPVSHPLVRGAGS
jgi:pimeloyl-ACP methyl ester carboxylesterase